MKSNLQAFDAMTVMVQYLSQDVGGLKVKRHIMYFETQHVMNLMSKYQN